MINLTGLEGITYITGDLIIGGLDKGNRYLSDLSGLENIDSIGGSLGITDNTFLTSITSLMNLCKINGELGVAYNSYLESLNGLDSIDSESLSGLWLIENMWLTDCAIKSICEYLENPNPYNTHIYNNTSGCNSSDEIEEECLVDINDKPLCKEFSIHPNPFTASTTIEYTLNGSSTVQVSIYNHLGKQVDYIQQQQSYGPQQITWNAKGLPSGVYYYRIQTGDQVASGKMVLVR